MSQSDLGTIMNLDVVERQALAFIVGELEKSRMYLATDTFLPFLKSLGAGNRLLVILKTFEGLGILTPETPRGSKLARHPLHWLVIPAFWRIEGKAVTLHRELLGREPAEQQPVNRKKHRGRPADTDPEADKRTSDAWESGQYKDYADLARALRLREKDVGRAIDRHRKRLKRNSAKCRNNSPDQPCQE